MANPLQQTFTVYEQTYSEKRTRRQLFLEGMETTVPFGDFLGLTWPVYHQPSARGGIPPFTFEVMIRNHLSAG